MRLWIVYLHHYVSVCLEYGKICLSSCLHVLLLRIAKRNSCSDRSSNIDSAYKLGLARISCQLRHGTMECSRYQRPRGVYQAAIWRADCVGPRKALRLRPPRIEISRSILKQCRTTIFSKSSTVSYWLTMRAAWKQPQIKANKNFGKFYEEWQCSSFNNRTLTSIAIGPMILIVLMS